jgi:hypothetical protein
MKRIPILMSGPMVRASLHPDPALRKTETRRLPGLKRINASPDDWCVAYPDGAGTGWIFWSHDGPDKAEFTRRAYPGAEGIRCPYGNAGDILWYRETWCNVADDDAMGRAWDSRDNFRYRATEPCPADYLWHPSIFMPREAARLRYRVGASRPERLHAIDEAGAIREGMLAITWLDLIELGASRRALVAAAASVGFTRAVSDVGPANLLDRWWDSLPARSRFIAAFDLINPGAWALNPWCWVISDLTRVESP